MSSTHAPASGHVDYQEVQARPQFRQLRKTHRSFVFPMMAIFLIWYLVYIMLAAFAPEFMAIKVLGNINLGIVMGLLQFVSTFVITGIYVSFANRKMDPPSTEIREELEAAGVGLPDDEPAVTVIDDESADSGEHGTNGESEARA